MIEYKNEKQIYLYPAIIYTHDCDNPRLLIDRTREYKHCLISMNDSIGIFVLYFTSKISRYDFFKKYERDYKIYFHKESYMSVKHFFKILNLQNKLERN